MRKIIKDGSRIIIVSDEKFLWEFAESIKDGQTIETMPLEPIDGPAEPTVVTVVTEDPQTIIAINDAMSLYSNLQSMANDEREQAVTKCKAAIAVYLANLEGMPLPGKEKLMVMGKEIKPFFVKTIKEVEKQYGVQNFRALLELNEDFDAMFEAVINQLRVRIR